MTKECCQLKRPKPTSCFIKADNVSCQEDDCLVESRIRELQANIKGTGVNVH